MSTDVAGGRAARRDGIRVTWRETPRATKALLLGVFVNRLAAFIQIFLVLFLTQRGFSAGQAGFALGMYGAGAVLGTFFGGSLTDRLDPRTATVISMMGSAVLIVAILYVPVYPALLLAVLAVSTVGTFYRPAAQALITELTPPSRLVMVTAMYRLGLNLGTTAAPLVGAALVAVSYDLLFWGEALAALAYGLIAIVALPRATATDRPARRPAERASGGYLAVLADRRYTVFLVSVLLLSAVYCQYTATLPLAIAQAGLSVWWYGAVVSLNGFIVITCELVMTRVVQHWRIWLRPIVGQTLITIGYGLYAVHLAPAILILGTLVWSIAETIGAPTAFAYPGMTAPEHLRGRYIAAMQSMFGVGAALGPIVGILVWNQVGQAVWLWVAFVSALATVALAIGVREPARPAEASPAPDPAQPAEASPPAEPAPAPGPAG